MNNHGCEYLWHKYEAEGARGTKYDENRNKDEGSVLMFIEDCRDGRPEDAHDGHVVDGHAHVLGVVQCWDLGEDVLDYGRSSLV